ncbi:hypothetical protein MIS46_10850 [Wielerella bovis]|uniref:hypothetical protein n=1 Tax=Wielerella bovis TaxID=2917790 RepID=UPI002018A0FA|nr:hypothetical protein [Wielerella bovis]ULJ62431.1 hypothetical protein MIS46_10850 [Wielerella bovis]
MNWFKTKFPQYQTYSRSGKIIVWLTFANILNYLVPTVLALTNGIIDLLNTAILIYHIVLFWFLLHKKLWAWYALIPFYILSSFQFELANGVYFFMKTALIVSFGFVASGAKIVINFASLIILFFILKNIHQIKRENLLEQSFRQPEKA